MRLWKSPVRLPEPALKRSLAILALLPASLLVEVGPASARQVEEPDWYDNAPRFPDPPRTDAAPNAAPRDTRKAYDDGPSQPAARAVPKAGRHAKHRVYAAPLARPRRAVGTTPRRAHAVRDTRRDGPRTARVMAQEPPPLDHRSVLAAHPLLLDSPAQDPAVAAALALPSGAGAAPRCRVAAAGALTLTAAAFVHGFDPSEPAMVEGNWPHCRPARAPQSKPKVPRVRLASLGPMPSAPKPAERPPLSASGGSIRWIASPGCLAPSLRNILAQVASNFGPLTVNSTCRSPRHNRRVGGAPRSYHLTGDAVDFRVGGSYGRVLTFLSRLRTVGGLKHYGRGVFHIDTGPRRTWGARRYARR
jgi:hypothetical protein